MKSKVAIGVLCGVIALCVGVSGFMLLSDKIGIFNPKVVTVNTPNQTAATTPDEFKVKEATVAAAPTGDNLALNKRAEANGYNDVYKPSNVTDGSATSYWEGKSKSYPNEISVDLGAASNVTALRIKLNPAQIWSKRTQTIEVQSSDDGDTYKQVLAAKEYEFDPSTGNLTDIPIKDGLSARYVKLIFTTNTQASAGQVAEFEIYGK